MPYTKFMAFCQILLAAAALVITACASTPDAKSHPPTKHQKTAVSVSPEIQSQFAKALDLMQQNKTDEAKSLLEAITKSHPTLAGPWVNLGIIYLRTHQLERALESLQNAVAQSPSTSDAYLLLAHAQRNSGKFQDAEKTLKNGLERFPHHTELSYNLAILYDLYLNNTASAIAQYEHYQEQQKEPDANVTKWLEELRTRSQQEVSQ
jgi:predicted Zn-dependent protease